MSQGPVMTGASSSTESDGEGCRYLRAAIPADLRIYAITDIHGRLDLLDNCLAVIDRHQQEHPIDRTICVFMGDYIDRGRWSRETIDRMMARGADSECVFLKGNHEQVALEALGDLDRFAKWMRIGGGETLQSYGVAPPAGAERDELERAQRDIQQALPPEHLQFLSELQSSFSCGDFFFVHAGVRPGVPFEEQTDADLLWIRRAFLNSQEDFGKVVIHGHTPQPAVDIRCNRVNLDTGAYGSERLSCLMLEGARKFLYETRPDDAMPEPGLVL